MYQLYRKGRSREGGTNDPADVTLTPTSSGRSLRTNILLAVAFILFVIVVIFAGVKPLPKEVKAKKPKAVQAVVSAATSGKDKSKVKAAEAKAKAKEGGAKPAPKVITTIEHKGKKLQILDEPVPETCYATQHADYDGYAVQWGLGNKARSAAECCKMCQDFKKNNPTAPNPCNVWVWCGDPSGKCWTMDIHDHSTGDCWLKFQKEWDNNPDRKKSNLKVNHLGKFSVEFKAEHKSAPVMVPWVAGLVPAKGAKQ